MLLSDLVKSYQLNYTVQKSHIEHKIKRSSFSFIGLREQGRFNIKGLEGTDVLWIEEGQAVTKPTMDIVLPTIRKTNSKIIVTMNRHLVNDPAYTMLVNRPDCLHINISYLENEFCSQELIKEANICKTQSQSDYDHVWMGIPLDKAEDAVYSRSELEYAKINKYNLRDGYGMRIAGFDIARYGDDKCAAVILQQMGALHWETILVDEWDHRDLNYTTGRILMTCNEHRVDKAIIDEDGMGAGNLDTLVHGRGLEMFTGFKNPMVSYQNDKEYANPRTRNAYKLKDLLIKNHIHITEDKLINELMTIKYTFDHNQRRILVSKEKMRKEGFKSPNMADALIMSVSLIVDAKENQDRQYRSKINTNYSKDDNLFNIAGVR